MTMLIANSKSAGLINGNVTIQTGTLYINSGNLGMGGGLITNIGTLAVNDSISIASGNSNSFMKTDSSSDKKLC